MGKHLRLLREEPREEVQVGAMSSFALPLETQTKCHEPTNGLVVLLQEQGYQALSPSRPTISAIEFWLL